MHVHFSRKYNKKVTIIYPGELNVSTQDDLIGTLLGSCVAVCLHDSKRGISGLNHFMLPGKIMKSDIFKDQSARYGITAMNALLKEIKDHGAHKKDLTAKVFGGGSFLNIGEELHSIPSSNIRLAKIILELEDIPITTMDVGGVYTRKIMLDVKSGKVYLKKSTRKDIIDKILARDENFAVRNFENYEKD